ncbi:hypothetical protein [Profundibacter sp.]
MKTRKQQIKAYISVRISGGSSVDWIEQVMPLISFMGVAYTLVTILSIVLWRPRMAS